MKKSARRRQFRPLRFLAFLAIVFAVPFFLMGGLAIFSPRTWQGVGDFLPALPQQLPAALAADGTQPETTSDRLARIVFLRRAVNSRVNRENFVTIDKMSPELVHAVVAVEDRRF